MLKAFAPVTWRKEIRARCQQISTSTWHTRRTLLCVYVRVYSEQSYTKDSGATQVIFQGAILRQSPGKMFSEVLKRDKEQDRQKHRHAQCSSRVQ